MSNTSAVDAALLASYIPIDALRPETREQLAKKAAIHAVAAGTILFTANEPPQDAIFVVEGVVGLEDEKGTKLKEVRGGTPESLHRLADSSSNKVVGRCVTDVRYLTVDAGLLDVLLTWEQTGSYQASELAPTGSSTDSDWMGRLLQMRSFQMVPPSNLQAMFLRMEQVLAEPGQVIVQQGDKGDYFYVVMEGRSMVTREQPGQKPLRLAELEAGSCFGEEALISDATRNATVTMLTRGKLMRLAKDDFRRFLNDPLMRKLPFAKAEEKVKGGTAKWLDVRLPTEYRNHNLPGSINIPLSLLRQRCSTLDPGLSYIVCCDTGRRSSAGVFILMQKGFEAFLLEKGLPAKKLE